MLLSPPPITSPAPVSPAFHMGWESAEDPKATGAEGAAWPLCMMAVPCQLAWAWRILGLSQCTAGCAASHMSTTCMHTGKVCLWSHKLSIRPASRHVHGTSWGSASAQPAALPAYPSRC